MQKIKREEVMPLEKYREVQKDFRGQVSKVKEPRRIHLGPLFTFLFENRDTLLYQIQEMIRVESIQNEKAIEHEIKTYNQLLPNDFELTSTLLIEIEDEDHRKVKLKELYGLEDHIFLCVDEEEKVKAVFDDTQFDEERISSVQFIRFFLGEESTSKFMNARHVEIQSTHPYYTHSQALNEVQLKALQSDLL